MWTIDTIDLGTIDGFELRGELVPDTDSEPADFDGYTTDQIRAWKRDDWGFCGIIVTASRAGIDLGSDSLWAVEYGAMPDIPDFLNPLKDSDYMADLIDNAIADARLKLTELEAAE